MKEWKKIIINDIETNYSVSTDGDIRNDNTNRILKQRTCNEYKKSFYFTRTWKYEEFKCP